MEMRIEEKERDRKRERNTERINLQTYFTHLQLAVFYARYLYQYANMDHAHNQGGLLHGFEFIQLN